MQIKCTPHPFHQYGCFRGSHVILRDRKGEPWSPELLWEPKLEGGPDLKGGTSDPSSYYDLNFNAFSK